MVECGREWLRRQVKYPAVEVVQIGRREARHGKGSKTLIGRAVASFVPADRAVIGHLRRPGTPAPAAKADGDHVRRQNRSLVLSALRRHAPVARVDLGTLTELSPATITAITADLIAEGLVETVSDEPLEGGEAEDVLPARRGRPRVHLRLDRRAALVLGVKLSVGTVTMVLSDFTGAIVAKSVVNVATRTATREQFPAELATLISRFAAENEAPLDHLAEIAIAAQGFVDTRNGSVMWSPAFEARDIRLVQPIESELGVPCSITNDANMIAEALHAADPSTYGGDFAVIFIDYGVGLGFFTGGRLHSGADGSAAEFGHMNHIPDGPLCRCGRRGCLEAFVADYAIHREAVGMPPDTDPSDAIPEPGALLALETAARAGDPAAKAVYERVGTALGYGVARLMALINPRRIVFTGASTRFFSLIEPAMQTAIEAALVEDLRRFTTFETLPWDRDMILGGLVADALSRLDRSIFASPANAQRFRGA